MSQTVEQESRNMEALTLPAGMTDRFVSFGQTRGSCLLLRHSLRYEPENQTPTFEVPLTAQGVALAEAAGGVLVNKTFQACSSASPRCLNTAKALLRGAGQAGEADVLSLLKEPGCFARQDAGVGKQFRALGPLGFVNGVLAGTVTGAEPADLQTALLVQTLMEQQRTVIAVTHDTILATVLGVLMGRELDAGDWPQMLEGVLLQRRDNTVSWFWRQQQGQWHLPTSGQE